MVPIIGPSNIALLFVISHQFENLLHQKTSLDPENDSKLGFGLVLKACCYMTLFYKDSSARPTILNLILIVHDICYHLIWNIKFFSARINLGWDCTVCTRSLTWSLSWFHIEPCLICVKKKFLIYKYRHFVKWYETIVIKNFKNKIF